MRYLKKGQSILEYTLLLGAIVAVLAVVLLKQGGIKSKVEDAYNKAGDAIGNVSSNMTQGVFGTGK